MFRGNAEATSLHYLVRGHGIRGHGLDGHGACAQTGHVLLIHGLGSSGADWALQVRALESRFHVIVPDLPGSGHSAAGNGEYSVEGFASALWALADHLKAPKLNIIGFSLGGAVALEMALQRPAAVPRLALLNTLTSYRVDHWRKWLEARLPPVLVSLIGMRRTAALVAARLFPHPWQRPLRERAAAVISAVPASCYLAMGRALERWSSSDRLHRLRSRTLMIAAEHDYTPLAEKHVMAAALGAQIVVVRGSRHGTPFDSADVTNACLLSLLTDQPLPSPERWLCDRRPALADLPFVGSLAEEHALAKFAAGQLERGF
jgi:pimeloyl-ACP methyl ester carboxylesterase